MLIHRMMTLSHRSPLKRSLLLLLLVALLFVATRCLVNSATATSVKLSASDKLLKSQFNDEHSSSKQVEASRQQLLPAGLASSSSSDQKGSVQKQSSQQQLSATNQAEISSLSAGSSLQAGQPLAEKKQGDTASQDLFGGEEYVQIKPEEITVNESGKEIIAGQVEPQSSGASGGGEQQQPASSVGGTEHKSADDELNAHLALDSISEQESAAYHSYSPLMQSRPQPAPRVAYPAPRQASYKAAAHPAQPMASPYLAGPQRGLRSAPRLPPSYITLKGKLTGINSIISQYPHPAPGYPHQHPRHLPHGAAAGYAAFRDFVRAHASKYKQAAPAQSAALAAGPSYPAPVHPMPQLEPTRYERPKELGASGYSAPAAPAKAPAQAYGAGGATSNQVKRAPLKTKVTVAQAYIPHLSAGPSSSAAESSYTNQALAKLYGGHAPQGVGKPEYSKDYGMVIHYPQATVYTEPMTVDQLHKLTGAGISQVLEQLQYNFAHGQRDESNTLRSNNLHHIGHGVTIHAKEYYAPGKSGQYVPTTAAVISTGAQQQQQYQPAYGPANKQADYDSQVGGYEEAPQADYNQQASSYGQHSAQRPAELGTGYERVRQAASSGSQRYNNKQSSNYAPTSGEYPQQQPHYGQPATYEHPSSNGYGNGEPLSAITSFIGSELEALYKANAALTKQLEPEIYSQLRMAGDKLMKAPLKYADIQQQSRPYQPAQSIRGPQYGGGHKQASGHRQRSPRPGYGPPRRPNNNRYFQQPQRQPNHPYNRQPAQHQQQGYGNRPQQMHQPSSSYQQQAAAYQATEQALNQQMMQLLSEFQAGDEQYNSKSQPAHSINQGYPNKVMQKYQQQQQQQQQAQSGAYGAQKNQQASAYAHHDGLEIPHGPNDQIGEIADLIEALKGSIDLQKPEQAGESYGSAPKQSANQYEEVRYLASALGQAPSYAMQVPVANAGESSGAGYEQVPSKASDQSGYQQHQTAAPASNGPYKQSPEAPAYQVQNSEAAYGASPAQSYANQQASSSYGQSAPQHPVAPVQHYKQPAAATGYQQTEQQQQTQADYQPQQAPQDYQQHSAAPVSDGYGAPQQLHHQVTSYAQTAPAAAASPAEQQSGSGYSSSEHSQVINHLVPVTTSSGATGDYSHGQQQQPAVSQIAIASPTESQYQQAQSLSSFVDSLATDYQELLRQPSPALLEPSSGSAAQLAVPSSQESGSSSYGSNGTAPAGSYDNAAAASQQVASSTSGQASPATSSQRSHAQTQTKSQSASGASSAPVQQQQYKKAAA